MNALQKTYIRKLTVQKMTCIQTRQKEFKNFKGEIIKSNVAVFQNEEGALIDADFRLPLNDITQKQVKKLMALCGATKFSEIQGKTLAVLVSGYVGKDGKKRWNPTGFHPVEDLNGEMPFSESNDGDIEF